MLDMQIKEPPVQSGDHEPVFDINDSERINDEQNIIHLRYKCCVSLDKGGI